MTPGRKLMLLVERMSGIVLPDRELKRLTNWAMTRATGSGFKDLNAYVDALRRDPDCSEWRVLLSRVTVKESSLFRAPQQFRCLSEDIIPELVDSGRKTLRVWSAGCARGEEPATLAVVLADSLAGTDVEWSVLGTDVDADALETARQARFSRRAVRRVPSEYLDRDFTIRGGAFELNPEIGCHIEFGSINLVREPLEVPGQPFDIILLRNVLIYFRKESQARVVRNIEQLLAPDGFLLIGPSESLMHLTPVLQAEERQGVFVYRRRDGRERDGATVPKDNKSSKILEHNETSKLPTPTDTGAEPEDIPADPGELAFEGHRAEMENDLRTALRCYRGSLYLQPDLYQVHYRLGHCLEAVGWTRRALAEYRTVLEILDRGAGQTLEIFDGPDFPGRDTIKIECQKATRSGSMEHGPPD
ncbi:MAG: hypothetical protein DRJ65_00505 [Acidobacteria bacterium]|nr:MAG: hypothetical protein DRJ65_00505 [Acidobacteriota bacterium]